MSARFGGIYAATVCPLDDVGRVDEPRLAEHLLRIAAVDGVQGFLVNGHAGENFTLNRDEKRQLLAVARRTLGDVPIVAGINAEATEWAVAEAVDAAATGADAVMIFPPFSWALSQDAPLILAHHEAVAEATDVPLFLYQAPVGAGAMAYRPALLQELVRLPSVVGIKEGSWETAAYEANRRLVHALRPDVAVMASGDEHLFACFAIGSEGSLVSLAALIPQTIVALERAVAAGDLDAARALNDRIAPLARAIYGAPPGGRATARLKHCLARLGHLPNAVMRRPMAALDATERERLDAALDVGGFFGGAAP
ncbi:MAG: dihydrodipicolinate synthase family protein [Pseudomonadota bacterium]